MPAWSHAQAVEHAIRGGKAKKTQSLLGAIKRVLRRPAEDGGEGTALSELARALVTKGAKGDVAAIKLLLERLDPVIRRHELAHAHIARQLVVLPGGDGRGREALAESVTEAAQVPDADADAGKAASV